MAKAQQPLLIAFTDEVGGTSRDTGLKKKNQITRCRIDQFSAIIENMQYPNWLVIKNVGDQLVIRFKPKSKNPSPAVSECVKILYDTWLKINKIKKKNHCKIRVALHFARNGFVTGDDLSGFHSKIAQKINRDDKTILNLWPSLKYINDDIFGYEMTRAARLISLPSKNAFILSHEVYNELDKTTKEYCNLRGPIPLILLKGLDNLINIGEPYCIWEATDQKNNDTIDSIFIQSKNFHTIRFIGIRTKYKETKRKYENNYETIMKPVIYEKLFNNKAINYYTDVVFNINKEWSGHSMTLSRIFFNENEELKFKLVNDIDKGKKIDWRSMTKKMILFTSSFDLRTDDIIRNEFSQEIGDWNMIPLTIFIHEYSRFKKSIWWENYDTSQIEELNLPCEVLKKERFYLILFQITIDYLSQADKPKVFFETDGQSISIEPDQKIKIHSYGLIKGEIDGYILLGVSTNEKNHEDTTNCELIQECSFDDEEINSTDVVDRVVFKYLKLNCLPHHGDPTFWPKIAPINLFSLNLERINPKWIEVGNVLNGSEE